MKARSYQVVINGTSYDVDVIPKEGGTVQVVPQMRQQAAPAAPSAAPAPAAAKAPAPAATAAPAPAAPAGGGANIKAPINGNIFKVNVKVGDTVTADTVLFILEAMKMENEIFAGTSGTVKSIAVKEGDAVEAGAALAVIG